MNNSTIIILGAILASPFLGVLAANIFGKKKTDAEAKAVNIGGEISIGDAWMHYATKMQDNFNELEKKFNELSDKFDIQNDENKNLRARVIKLEGILKANNITFDV